MTVVKISQDISFLKENISFKGLDVLEIGCGEGKSSQLFAEGTNSYIGIDIDADTIQKAQSSNIGGAKVQFELFATGANLAKFPNASFDVVLMFYTFHEISIHEQAKTLLESARVLRPHGKIVIMDPTLDGPVQKCFDIMMAETEWIDHPPTITHSEFVLSKAVSSGRFKLVQTEEFAITDSFENFESLLQFLGFGRKQLTAGQRDTIINQLKKLLNISDESQPIVLDDRLRLTVLEPSC